MHNLDNQRTIIEEELRKHGSYASTTRGFSMQPLFKTGRDVVIIKKPCGELKKYDVALYHGRNGSYVMHRVIRVLDNEYIIRGDNTFINEHVPKDSIIGVLTEFNRKGKKYTVNDRAYRIYSVIWTFIYPVRLIKYKLRRLAGKIYRKVFKRR